MSVEVLIAILGPALALALGVLGLIAPIEISDKTKSRIERWELRKAGRAMQWYHRLGRRSMILVLLMLLACLFSVWTGIRSANKEVAAEAAMLSALAKLDSLEQEKTVRDRLFKELLLAASANEQRHADSALTSLEDLRNSQDVLLNTTEETKAGVEQLNYPIRGSRIKFAMEYDLSACSSNVAARLEQAVEKWTSHRLDGSEWTVDLTAEDLKAVWDGEHPQGMWDLGVLLEGGLAVLGSSQSDAFAFPINPLPLTLRASVKKNKLRLSYHCELRDIDRQGILKPRSVRDLLGKNIMMDFNRNDMNYGEPPCPMKLYFNMVELYFSNGYIMQLSRGEQVTAENSFLRVSWKTPDEKNLGEMYHKQLAGIHMLP